MALHLRQCLRTYNVSFFQYIYVNYYRELWCLFLNKTISITFCTLISTFCFEIIFSRKVSISYFAFVRIFKQHDKIPNLLNLHCLFNLHVSANSDRTLFLIKYLKPISRFSHISIRCCVDLLLFHAFSFDNNVYEMICLLLFVYSHSHSHKCAIATLPIIQNDR